MYEYYLIAYGLIGSHAQKHQSNKNNTSLVLSVIGDLLRGNLKDVGRSYDCYYCCMPSSPVLLHIIILT